MASAVQICNLALSHLGDTASVASIDPPEGSAQAEHCARFYPIARDSLLEMHPWGFATNRVALAPLALTVSEWRYVYACPAGVVNYVAVLPPEATDDYSYPVYQPADYYGYSTPQVNPAAVAYTPQPYQVENLEGVPAILTNQANAVLRYTAIVEDTTRFSPLFTVSLSWLLASMLAGPILKGEVGAAEAKRCYQMFQAHFVEATQSDATQRRIMPQQVVPWMAGR